MPLSYKIALGSVALLCLVVIGFKAVSGGEDKTPQPIAGLQNQHGQEDTAGTSNGSNQPATNDSADTANTSNVSVNTNSGPVDASVEPNETDSNAGDENLLDVTRQLAASATDNNTPGAQTVTDPSLVNESTETTQTADNGGSAVTGPDSEDKGLDDLLARIRQYEEEVLGEDSKSADEAGATDIASTSQTNDNSGATDNSTNAEQSNVDAANEVTTTTDTSNSAAELNNTITSSNDGNATNDGNAITIPDNPPVVTLGQAAPIPTFAKIDDGSDKIDQITKEAEQSTVDDALATDNDTTAHQESDRAARVFDNSEANAANDVSNKQAPPTPAYVPVESGNTTTDRAATNTTSGQASTVALQPRAHSGKTYTIQPGDTFSSIAVTVYGAERHWMTIARANPKVDSRRLRVGQVIQLPSLSAMPPVTTKSAKATTPSPTPAPGKDTHIVRAGETLWAIAKQHYGKGEHWHHLYKVNRDVIGAKPGNVRAGMKLRIAALPVPR